MLRRLLLVLTFWSCHTLACEPAKDASRIAVAGGSVTEILYFLGEEGRIVATDSTSLFPPAATEFPSVGYVRNLSAEGLLSLKPTLVLGEDDMGPEEVLIQLQNTEVEVMRVPEAHTSAGIVDKVRCVAAILGVDAKAERLVSEKLAQQLSHLQSIGEGEAAQKPDVAVLLVFTEGAPIIAGTNTAGQGILDMAGARNAFAEIDGWKPVSLESMVGINPSYIVITERGVDSAGGLEAVRSHPAIRLTNAARNNRIFSLDGMSLLGFGPSTLRTAIELSEMLRSQ